LSGPARNRVTPPGEIVALPQRGAVAFASHQRLAIGLALAAAGELGLALPSAGAGAATLIPGFAITGIGSGANNTARYFAGAAGVALVTSSSGPIHPVAGLDRAALVSAGLCLVGAVIAARCRQSSDPGDQALAVEQC
jgi:hypothetical protein